MDYRVVLSISSRNDLRSIVRYISIDAPDRATRFGQLLVSRAQMGRVVPEFGDSLLRKVIVRRAYRVIYRIDHNKRVVEIVRFWHAARGIPEADKQ